MINVGDTVIQVGTPLTETIERIVKCLGPSGKAIVIEPNETNFQRLSDHLHHLGCQNIFIVKKAAWYEQGQHELLVSQKQMGGHRLRDDNIIERVA